MAVEQLKYTKEGGWSAKAAMQEATVVFVFGDGEYFGSESCFLDIRGFYPDALIVGCSTSGTIMGESLDDESVVVSAMDIDNSAIRIASKEVKSPDASFEVGEQIAKELMAEGLKHIFVLSDGLNINGTLLTNGLNSVLDESVAVSGGLAGDGTRFGTTLVMANSPAKKSQVVAVGFYGETLEIKTGCFAGWDEFGPTRVVTRSEGNVVYEIDSQPALELYKKYIGDDNAKELPAIGLRFPINVQKDKSSPAVIRTLLAVDEAKNSLTFAGDVPQGYICRLMKSNIDKLIENSRLAAKSAKSQTNRQGLCIAVSCVGRRLVLGQLTEEELECIGESLGEGVAITGFYSYGEIAPLEGVKVCDLHNQTMTLTVIYEKNA